jgi:hypothetical protein
MMTPSLNVHPASRWGDIAFFVALLATAIDLAPALAHVMALPNKIGLAREQYFIVQAIYAGWAIIAIVLVFQLIGTIAAMIIYRHDRRVFAWTLISLLGLLGAQAVFWIYTYPANAATNNWTQIPDNWETLRRDWEYSHTAGAGLQLLAMISLIIAALKRNGATR